MSRLLITLRPTSAVFCRQAFRNYFLRPTNGSEVTNKLVDFAPKPNLFFHHQHVRNLSTSLYLNKSRDEGEQKPGLAKRFKQMFRDYWYVLVPVHVATSLVWFGTFYVGCKSGVDVAAILQYLGASQEYVDKVSNSKLGYAALAYTCYKIATPARYTVTIGGTTMTVKYLSDLGYLRTTKEVAEDMRDRREKLKEEWISEWQKFAKKRRKN